MTGLSPTGEAMLSLPMVAVLSTIAGDGSPHATPVWFVWERGEVGVDVAAGSAKRRHVERDDRVALTLD